MTRTTDHADDVAYISAALGPSHAGLSADAVEDAWTRLSRSAGAEWRRTDNLTPDMVRDLVLPFASSSQPVNHVS